MIGTVIFITCVTVLSCAAMVVPEGPQPIVKGGE